MYRKTITIKEYQYITSDLNLRKKKNTNNKTENFKEVPDKTFQNLKNFVLENKIGDNDSELIEFLTFSQKKGIGEVLQAKNFVGTLETKDKVTIEILPKIYSSEINTHFDNESTRKIFLKMLKTLKDSPFRKFDFINLKSTKMPLFEIFISMFLKEIKKIIPKGLKSDYITKTDNLNVYKGKIKFSKHITKNIVHKERSYVEYDEYLLNRPENRIIKSTLRYLLNQTKLTLNSKLIRILLFQLDTVDESDNIDKDFKRCHTDRTMKKYRLILKWCKIFLNKESFTNFRGKSLTYALLFPMEKLFENYVTYILRKVLKFPYFSSQDSRFYLTKLLSNYNKNKFKLKPDIFARTNDNYYIFDAKWKNIKQKEESKNFCIAQSDFYQLYAYSKIYRNKLPKELELGKLFLIYPKTDTFNSILEFQYYDNTNSKLIIFPFDLAEKEKNQKELKNCIK